MEGVVFINANRDEGASTNLPHSQHAHHAYYYNREQLACGAKLNPKHTTLINKRTKIKKLLTLLICRCVGLESA